MIDQGQTRIERTYEIDVLSTDVILEAGLALQGVVENDRMKARRSNAVANAIFLGVSWGDYLGWDVTQPALGQVSSSAPDILVSSSGVVSTTTLTPGTGSAQVLLPRTATNTADMTVIVGTDYGSSTPLIPVALGSVNDATKYALSADGTYIEVNNLLANSKFFIAQRYNPSAQELLLSYGDNFWPTSAAQMGRIGVIQRGEVFTNDFDTSLDWSTINDFATAHVIVGGANGRFTVNSTGALCRNTTVLKIPSISSPYLGLRLEI
jgi:hypothetical protein